nr:lipid transfer-like protein VAS isoform X2 [Solanum lycopersicum]
MFSSKFSWLITVAISAALLSATITDAQTTSCASKLVPCAPFLNSTSKPLASCCDPLREAVTKDLQCICKLFENPTLLPSLGINVTQVIALLKNCNIPGNVNTCKAAAPSSSSPSGKTPPVTTPASKDKNGVSTVAWTGMSSLLMLFASFVLA